MASKKSQRSTSSEGPSWSEGANSRGGRTVQQTGRHRGLRIPPWIFLVAVGVVAIVALTTQALLLRAAQRDRQAVVSLAQLFVKANDLRTKQWVAISAMQESGSETAAQPLADFAQALDTFSSDGAPASAQTAFTPFLSKLNEELALLRAENADQAFTTAAQQSEPAFEQGLGAVASATTVAANHAHEKERISQLGSIIAMVAATALIGLLFWRFEHSREAMRGLELEQEALRKSEARFRPLVQNSSDIIMVLEPDLAVRYASAATERLLGHEVSKLVGVKLTELVHPEEAEHLAVLLPQVKPQETTRIELQLRRADGSYRYGELIGTNLIDDANIQGFVLNVRDVTERKTLEDRLRHQAFHDSLTVLPNRARLQDRLEQALVRARRQGTSVALLFLDLDDFKTINDTLGHSAGDEVLVHVAERLRQCLREQDLASRLGGDEFAVLLEDVAHVGDAIAAVERIFNEMKEPFDVAGRHFSVQASIGIAMSSVGNEVPVEALLRNADVAMYVAKARGKGRYEVYDQHMQEGMMERLALRGDLEQALARQELEVHYQPIFDMESHHVVSLEALLRWRHPDLGLISAAEFIPVAEETGLIVPIGSWVLREACKQWRTWRDAYPTAPPFSLCVNISVKQVDQAGFVKEVEETIRETGIEPGALVLEITESAPVRDAEHFVGRLQQFKQLGIKLALDDFGTGHSSFNYLRQLPVDILKIDRSFIEGLGEGDERESLVRAIVDVGQALGLQIVPEGVEQQDQATTLAKLGCSVAQGYYFSRPIPAVDIEKLLLAASSVEFAA